MKSANEFQIGLVKAAIKFHEKHFGQMSDNEKERDQERQLFAIDWINENGKSFRKLWESIIPHFHVNYRESGLETAVRAKYDMFQLEEFLDRVNICNRYPDRKYYNIKIVEV